MLCGYATLLVMKAPTRADEIIKAIKLAWSSLDSHLDYCVKPIKDKKFKRIHGGATFHKKCVKEYSIIIKTLADSL